MARVVKCSSLTHVVPSLQEVKELVRGTRQAVGSNFLGSLESFLVYLESLMGYCRLFLADKAAENVMKVCTTLAFQAGAQFHLYLRIPCLAKGDAEQVSAPVRL